MRRKNMWRATTIHENNHLSKRWKLSGWFVSAPFHSIDKNHHENAVGRQSNFILDDEVNKARFKSFRFYMLANLTRCVPVVAPLRYSLSANNCAIIKWRTQIKWCSRQGSINTRTYIWVGNWIWWNCAYSPYSTMPCLLIAVIKLWNCWGIHCFHTNYLCLESINANCE